MNNKRLKQIHNENNIWIIYIVIIILSFYSNYLETDYFLNNNIISKDKYRKINIIIFTTLLIVYMYYENDAYNSFISKDKTKYDNLIFIATTLVLISGIIFLYIVLKDNDISSEIAFSNDTDITTEIAFS